MQRRLCQETKKFLGGNVNKIIAAFVKYLEGGSMSVFIIGKIGINHNGDLKLVKKLIDAAAEAGCDAVKFQKRTVEAVYTKEFLDSPRESPWGITQREHKMGIEFGVDEYKEIDRYCKKLGIE